MSDSATFTTSAFTKDGIVGFVTAVRKEQDTRNTAKFVAKETGKSLISDTEITRLAGIETGAQVNLIEGISILEGSAAVEIDSSTKLQVSISEIKKVGISN